MMNYLSDSNIIIYLETEKAESVGDFLQTARLYISQISIIEVLGYHKITPSEIVFSTLF